MSWYDGRLACFDLETTSADPEEARIVQGSVVYVGAGEPTDTVTLLVDPHVEIPEEATAIHGITTEHARTHGMAAGEAVWKIIGLLEKGYPIVVFNTPYDLTVLDREARRYSLPPLENYQVVDPLVLDHFLHRYRKGKRNLAATCEHYGKVWNRPILERGTLHGAAEDAIAAGRLAWILGKHGKVIRRRRNREESIEFALLVREWNSVRDDLDALQEAQRRWHRARMDQLERYLHEGNPAKGVPPQPERVVSRAWPVIPARSLAVAA